MVMPKEQFNIRLEKTQKQFLKELAAKYRTQETTIFEAYIEWLQKGNVPIGYPGGIDGAD